MSKPSDKSRPLKLPTVGAGTVTFERSGSEAEIVQAVSTPYVVLARKYRPQTFEDLIGQDMMVRTLRNAFAMDRVAQAYMLTGVRGVGKTTTARILARALNYQQNGSVDIPTLDMPELGIHCQAIMESRHVDVLEMDAASHTGIDDIREIIEAVRYKPAAARYRVFIIDEVHMLSKSAFNGLLKTLEEPPAHVKFIFATTEIRKVPVTILSRCQRFDLRRVDPGLLTDHFAQITAKEGHSAEPEALTLLARAAEGSVRDGLSLLDQALALGRGHVTPSLVLEMLGIAGRRAIFQLLGHLFRGDSAAALGALGNLYDAGGDPAMVLTDIADAVHTLSRLKAVPNVYPADFSIEDRERADKLAAGLTIPKLAMAWQMLLKGLDEVSRAARPFAAAEMLLIRMCYTAGLPSPAEIIGSLKSPAASVQGAVNAAALSGEQNRNDAAQSACVPLHPEVQLLETKSPKEMAPAPRFQSFEEITAHAGEIRDIKLKIALEEHVELVQFGQGFLELHVLTGAPGSLAQDLSRKLQSWTGDRWVVSLSDKRGQVPLAVQRREEEAKALEEVRKHPTVKRVMHLFPGAEIKTVRNLEK